MLDVKKKLEKIENLKGKILLIKNLYPPEGVTDSVIKRSFSIAEEVRNHVKEVDKKVMALLRVLDCADEIKKIKEDHSEFIQEISKYASELENRADQVKFRSAVNGGPVSQNDIELSGKDQNNTKKDNF